MCGVSDARMHSGPSCICVLKLVEVCIGAAISVTLVRPEVWQDTERYVYTESRIMCSTGVRNLSSTGVYVHETGVGQEANVTSGRTSIALSELCITCPWAQT